MMKKRERMMERPWGEVMLVGGAVGLVVVCVLGWGWQFRHMVLALVGW